jgi:hypothetical protein
MVVGWHSSRSLEFHIKTYTMKSILLAASILVGALFTHAQKPYTPHVVYDDNNKVYAVKATQTSFLKFIDSTGTFLYKQLTNGKDYFGKGHTVRLVPAGQETTYETKETAQALLDYWQQLVLQREESKKKPSHYGD